MKHRSMMHRLYTVVMYVLTPVIMYRLAVRGLKAKAYFRRWKERFGFFPKPDFSRCIWVHAVSMGEVNAALGLVRRLTDAYPQERLVVTTVTPTGSERLIQVLGDSVFHVYLPYDLPAAVGRFLDRVKPVFAVVMETEIWPNLFCSCHDRGIPIVVANARLSERSLRGYRPVQSLAAMALNCATRVGAQTRTDADRLLRLGGDAHRIDVVGSLKFDIAIDPKLRSDGLQMRRHWGEERFVFVAASTHEDDEVAVMDAFAKLRERDSRALLIIVPRHPERFPRAIARCRSTGLRTATRTLDTLPDPDTDCFVVDTMGELLRFYAAADVAFVGGSISFVGGHNVLEPAALGIPVLVGPHTFNFSEITELLLSEGGAVRVADGAVLGTELLRLCGSPEDRRRMSECALALVDGNRGALDRTMEIIHQAWEESPLCPELPHSPRNNDA